MRCRAQALASAHATGGSPAARVGTVQVMGPVGTMLRLAKAQVYRMLTLLNTPLAKSSWSSVFSAQTEGSMTRVFVAWAVALVEPVTLTDTCRQGWVRGAR